MTADPAFVENATIEVTEVSKWFGQKVAVSNLSCSFGVGVTGLLGPNGAGKTTLLRMLTGLTSVSSGSISLLGKNPRRDSSIYSDLAFVPDEDSVYAEMNGLQFVEHSARLAGVVSPRQRAVEAVDAVAMAEAADRNIGGYSKGMRQRIKVAAALVTHPRILFLDEPLNGTDPVQRAHLIDLFQELGNSGSTVIVSSHVLEEVERVSTRVIAVVDGRLAAAGSVEAIRAAMEDKPYVVSITADEPRKLGAGLITSDQVQSVSIEGDRLTVQTSNITELGRIVPEVAATHATRVSGFIPQDESLESVFRYLVERR